MKFCRSIYVKKVLKLLAFIFEQPSYKIELLLVFCCWPCARPRDYRRGYRMHFDRLSESCDISACDLNTGFLYKSKAFGIGYNHTRLYGLAFTG